MQSQSKGTQTGHAKITDAIARKIRHLYVSGQISQSQLGIEFGISQTNVGFIVRGKTWKHV